MNIVGQASYDKILATYEEYHAMREKLLKDIEKIELEAAVKKGKLNIAHLQLDQHRFVMSNP
jgi:hypothetical protein